MRCLTILFIAAALSTAQTSLSSTESAVALSGLRFTAPLVGSILQNDLCTLAIAACDTCTGPLTIKAIYTGTGGMRDSILLGTISNPPYNLLWNIRELPDQFLGDLTLQAELPLVNGIDTLRARRDGIFIIRHPILRPRHVVPYINHRVGFPSAISGFAIKTGNNNTVKINAELYRNDNGIKCIVTVIDPAFSTQAPEVLLRLCGITVLLEPSITNRPVPDEKTFAFFSPLSGTPIRIFYQSDFSENGFNLLRSTIPYTAKSQIKTENGKGFTIELHIARALFGNTLPDSMGCNILVTTMAAGQTINYSWSGGYGRQMLSPATWGILQFQPRSLLNSLMVWWLLAYSLGCAAIIGGYILYTRFFPRGLPPEIAAALPVTTNFKAIKNMIAKNLTNREFTIAQATQQSELKAGALNALTRKATRLSFRDYLFQCRAELAKERLRSSHSSEVSIAEQCAFASVSEMERYFKKFYHTTPYNFRKEYQIG